MHTDARAIALSLISHTNAGKTTLARTLLGRDVGEVRDAAHVTTEATPYPLIDTAEGDTLLLWDTPGFGDSARLARRLAQQGNPIGWFLSQIWDRFRDQPFYLSQQAVRNVRDEADVVLYLVNAAEAPADAGYLAPELDVLAWIGRPVVVLLNQTGPPRPHTAEQAEVQSWRAALGERAFVRDVLTLDAFARCWVQEIVLLRTLAASIVADKAAACQRLVAAWTSRRERQFAEAMAALAKAIAGAACDSETLTTPRLRDQLRTALRSVVAGEQENVDRQRAAKALASRLDGRLRASTERLIAVHELSGHAADAVRARIGAHLRTQTPLHSGKAAAVSGVVSGALSGLAADLAAGGLSFGAGTLLGALAGAAGGAGVARGVNKLRGHSEARVGWDDELLDSLVVSALLRYLAVAHFGRGRGEWAESEYPPFWREVVEEVLATRRPALAALWAERPRASNVTSASEEMLAAKLRRHLADAAREVLERLYPGAIGDATRG
ncbi:MAG: putative GTPase [Candidatus Accumulibacter adjunctus]|uniref:GTPase n=1 Tax=Candidatus Accumulibacter adjunctus TaxID=1454001 RepID=A0A011NKY5_9PROT|nr:MAG: putative GTPase [Candidatus Accumulibacter adjunctus]